MIDDTDGYLDSANEPFELVRSADWGSTDFEAMAARYDVLELSTAVKPWLLRHLLDDRGLERLAYLDPDIQVFAPLTEVDTLLDEHEMVLIPHLTEPIPRDGRKPSRERHPDRRRLQPRLHRAVAAARGGRRARLVVGAAASATASSTPARGYFVDQRWMDLLPGLLTAICRAARHGLQRRLLEPPRPRPRSDGDGGYRVDGAPAALLSLQRL